MKIIEEGFIKRNKKGILVSLVIFLVFLIAGAVIANIHAGDNAGMITEMMRNASENGTMTTNINEEIGLSSIDLFIHNSEADFIILLGGLLFSIPSLILTIINAVSIGSIFGTDLTYALVSVLPHAIVEYAATVLALTGAVIITKIEIKIIKNRDFKNTIKESKTELKDLLVLIIIIVILLAIAAIIEAHITTMILEWYFF